MQAPRSLIARAAWPLIALAGFGAVLAVLLCYRVFDGAWPERTGAVGTAFLYPLIALPLVHALLP